jgi:AMME syndrome candidate gene 1 protein
VSFIFIFIRCGSHRISLLTDFEDASSYLDWTVGVHGIYISFPHPSLLIASESSTPSPSPSSTALFPPSSSNNAIKQSPLASYRKTFSATYLPEVMPSQGWNKIEAVDSAIHKAGWSGRITEEIRRSVKLRRYQSRVCTVGWNEFVEWRKVNGGKVD